MPFKFPEGTEFWKPKEGQNIINIVPYLVNFQERYSFEYGCHFLKDYKKGYVAVLCKYFQFREICPICKMYDDYSVAELRQKRRIVYNVLDLNDPSEKVKIWDAPYFLTERQWGGEINNRKLLINFACIKRGPAIDYKTINLDTSLVLKKAVLDQAINPTKYLIIPTPGQLELLAIEMMARLVPNLNSNKEKIVVPQERIVTPSIMPFAMKGRKVEWE